MEAPIIIWPCYEPAGFQIALTEAELVQQILVVGSTGSGKTTLLTSATQQLIAHDAQTVEGKLGLLLLDAKVDGMVEQVRADARAAGRERDVMVFGPNGDCAFDLFGSLRSLDDVERIARRIMLGTEPLGGENTYWQQVTNSMVTAALTLLVAADQPITFPNAVEFMRRWFLSPSTPADVSDLAQSITSQQAQRRHSLLAAALDQIKLWAVLDLRTRSNTQTCLLNVLRPLIGTSAVRCFSPRQRAASSPSLAATAGKLCVISVSALTDPELAKFFFRLAKQEFFDAIQSRRGRAFRLCGLVADEFPLVVTRDDVEQLGTIRSKRAFVIAATQGLDGITQRLGIIASRAVVNHFNTVVLMRTREAETAVFAFLGLGSRLEPVKPPKKEESDFGATKQFQPAPSNPTPMEVPVCPVGALGRLAPHQGFVIFPDGRRTEHPVWFAPWFERAQSNSLPVDTNPPVEIPELYFSAGHVENLMQWAGFRQRWSPEVVAVASRLISRERIDMLEVVTIFFQSRAAMIPKGLEQLPNCWLAALPGILWKLKKQEWTHLPFFIDQVRMQDGLLLLHFVQEQAHETARLTAWDRIRIAVNASLYPSIWRPLAQRHRKQLCQLHPELHAELTGTPPAIE